MTNNNIQAHLTSIAYFLWFLFKSVPVADDKHFFKITVWSGSDDKHYFCNNSLMWVNYSLPSFTELIQNKERETK